VIYCNPSENELKTIELMLEIRGVKLKIEKIDGVPCLALEIEGIKNREHK